MSVLDDFVALLESNRRKSMDDLLSVLLAKLRRVTHAEGGSIFLTRPIAGIPDHLESFSLQNDTLNVQNKKMYIPMDETSIAGYVASTGKVLEIDDLYALNPNHPFHFNPEFDEKNNYVSRSMLAFPLKNHQGDVIGVVQLLNHIKEVNKEGENIYNPFPLVQVDQIKSFRTVLGVLVERVDLLQEIERLRKIVGPRA